MIIKPGAKCMGKVVKVRRKLYYKRVEEIME